MAKTTPGVLNEAQRPSELDEAWQFVNMWMEKTSSRRLGEYPEEDAVVFSMGILGRLGRDETLGGDMAIGQARFKALGDSVEVELFDPRKMLAGITPIRSGGMPMQGLLSTKRLFENTASLIHVGLDGELYPHGEMRDLVVNSEPMNIATKLAVFSYFSMRAEAVER